MGRKRESKEGINGVQEARERLRREGRREEPKSAYLSFIPLVVVRPVEPQESSRGLLGVAH